MAEEPSLSYYLPIAGGRIIGFIPFPRVLVLCEMQSVSSRIWTRIAVFISYGDNDYTTGTSYLLIWYSMRLELTSCSQYFGHVKYNSAASTNQEQLWDIELTWYSPYATCRIYLLDPSCYATWPCWKEIKRNTLSFGSLDTKIYC